VARNKAQSYETENKHGELPSEHKLNTGAASATRPQLSQSVASSQEGKP